MEVTTRNDTFVFDVPFQSDEVVAITLDSEAGIHVWPPDELPEVMVANGGEIKSYGRKLIKFRENDFGKQMAERSVFGGRLREPRAAAALQD